MARTKNDASTSAPKSRAASTPAPKGRAGSTPAPKGKKERKPFGSRWYGQIWQAYQMTRKTDHAVTWWMLGAFVGILAVAVVIGSFWQNHLTYMIVLGVPFALIAALLILTRRAEKAAYQQLDGQPGASRSALGTIRRGWTFSDEPVAIDPRTQDLVFRAIGRPGVVLISEGPAHRVGKLLEAERKKTVRVLPSVPIHLIQSGNDEGQVTLRKLANTVRKLRPKLTKQEVSEVGKRLTSLGGVRLPIPKGIDPTRARPDRKGMRGR